MIGNKRRKNQHISIKQDDGISVLNAALEVQYNFNMEMERHNRSLYSILSTALDLRAKFEDKSAWKKLCDHFYWTYRRERNRPHYKADAEKRTMALAMFLFAGPKFVNADRAGKYGRIIHYAYVKSIPAEDFAEYIKSKGGVEALLKKARESDAPSQDDDEDESKEQAKAAKRDETVNNNELPKDQDDQSYEEDEDDENRPRNACSLGPGRYFPPDHAPSLPVDLQQRIVDKRMICIETTVEQTLSCLELPAGQRVLIEATVGKSSGCWKRLVAKRVKPKRQ